MATDLILRPKSQCPLTGPEEGPSPPPDGIARYTDLYGSSRYVLYRTGIAIAAIQVVSREGRQAVIANVYVDPVFRRKGLATKLLQRALQDHDIAHSSDLTPDGQAWSTSESVVAALLAVSAIASVRSKR